MKKNKIISKYNTWIIGTLVLTLAALILFAAFTIYIDPWFHYHAPLKKYAYPLNNAVYQNDGILRNFKYNSLIIGTSMTENFKTSEANELFHEEFIKIPCAGEGYKRANDLLTRAYKSGHDIKYVIRSIDYTKLIRDKDYYEYSGYPLYLYNDNIFDDLNYVLNKSVFINQTYDVIRYTKEGNTTTSFDVYNNWSAYRTYGMQAVLSSYHLEEKAQHIQTLTDEERIMVQENVRQNVKTLILQHPETTFYLFFPPYSICYWDELHNNGQVDWRIDAEEIAIKELIDIPNVKLFSFCDDFDLICNLDNYADQAHYGEWVNSWMLEWMYADKHLLTEDNYQKYLETIRTFYNTYDYASLHTTEET